MESVDIQEILEILPHRYPMLMVDRILELDSENGKITGLKNLTFNEPFLQGHFPGTPIMPGVLQIEAMAQVGGILLARKTGARDRLPLLMAVDKAKFRSKVYPGDQLRIQIEIVNMRSRTIRCRGVILVDGKTASEAELMFMFGNAKVGL